MTVCQRKKPFFLPNGGKCDTTTVNSKKHVFLILKFIIPLKFEQKKKQFKKYQKSILFFLTNNLMRISDE